MCSFTVYPGKVAGGHSDMLRGCPITPYKHAHYLVASSLEDLGEWLALLSSGGGRGRGFVRLESSLFTSAVPTRMFC